MDKQLLAVVVGVISALLVVYLREALSRAIQQKAIAARIEAYLNYWGNKLIEDPWSSFHWIGVSLNDRITNAYLKKGKDAALAEIEKTEEDIRRLKIELCSNSDEMKVKRKFVLDNITQLTDEAYNHCLEEMIKYRTALLDNKVFVSDQESAILSWYATQQVVKIRICLFDGITAFVNLLIYCRNNETMTPEKFGEYAFALLRPFVKFSGCHVALGKYVRLVQKRSLLYLTIRNMFGAELL